MNVPKLRFKDNNGNNYPQWEKKQIKDILKICHGKDYKNKPNEKNLYPVLGTGGIITYIDKFLCDWKCVLIGRKGTINKPQYMETPFWSVDTLFYSKPKLKQNPKFQYYLFQNINWKIYDESTGVPSLSASTIEHINKFIPTYAEQNKIANFLSTVDKKISNLENIITTLEKQKKGLLQKIFNQEIHFKDENDKNYPDWEKEKIGLICSISTGKSNTQDKTDDGKYPFYVRSATIERSSKYLYDEEAILTVGDGVGTGKVFHYVNGKYDLHQRCYRMFNFKNTNAKYFYYFFSSHFYNRVRRMSAKNSVDSVRMNMISDMIIDLPCLEEQTKIADFLSAFDRKIDNQKAQLEHWKQIKKGLLQQMFV